MFPCPGGLIEAWVRAVRHHLRLLVRPRNLAPSVFCNCVYCQ